MHALKKYLFVLLCFVAPLAFLAAPTSSQDLDCGFSTRSPRDISDNLLEKMRNGRFDQVEQCIDNMLASGILTLDGERLLEAVYVGLKDRREAFELADQWCALKDAKHPAFVLRGLCLLESAWDARGYTWGRWVPADRMALMREKALRAKQDLEKAYRLNPSDPNSAAAMIGVCMALGLDEETMEQWFKRALRADPVCYYGYSSKLTYLTPRWYGSREKMEKTVNDCRVNAPEGTGVCYHVWIEYLAEKKGVLQGWKEFMKDPERSQQVADVFDSWLREFPQSTMARVIKGRIHIGLENEEEAIKYCTEALEILPNHIDALACRADAYFNSGDYKNAERDCRKVLEIDPDQHYSLFTLGTIFIHGYGDSKEAIRLLTRAISMNPWGPVYYVERGKAQLTLKDYAAAIIDFDKAIDIDPAIAQSYHYRGMSKYFLGDYESPKADFRAAIRLDPEFGEAYYYLGACYDKLNDIEMARENYLKAKQHAPTHRDSVNRHLKDLERREHDTSAVVATGSPSGNAVHERKGDRQVEPDWQVRAEIQALHEQAAMHRGKRDIESAEKDLLKILELDSDNDYAWFMLGEIAYYPTKDYRKAIEYYDKAISINATDKRYFHQRGMSKYFLNDRESAKADFSSATQLDPKFGEAYYYLGQCFQTLGKKDQARENYLKAKEYAPAYRDSANRHLKDLEKE
jgi:tetratricopeptide (TPR) repeat protein